MPLNAFSNNPVGAGLAVPPWGIQNVGVSASVKFWMVAGPGPTTHRHPTYELACVEAKRLAELPGNGAKKFFVMEAAEYYSVPKTEAVSFSLKN